MSFWAEFAQAEAERPKPETAKLRRMRAAVERLPATAPDKPCALCGANPADLFTSCLPCDITDGYL